ncbi:hypothetical protein CLOBOL_00552 [Enterocloster bolteae ATCC BAA-613]|uniref:Uncharacterized protein n=1 Tax=Enterocloster bolteae (strain ATCC BAA-613 / DSM 15670 / CCUG 46953 / JCM 12243 / WAL 16351) TaxID=411902 RepID=A8RHZ9_ENTBW|nr:hypothetical protein CLOBOL_00552 [Enterocloster bolteae ATCC BAA-613]
MFRHFSLNSQYEQVICREFRVFLDTFHNNFVKTLSVCFPASYGDKLETEKGLTPVSYGIQSSLSVCTAYSAI